MRPSHLITAAAILSASLPTLANAAVSLYSGTLKAITVSGRQCEGQLGDHRAELVLRRTPGSDLVSGYFSGQGFTTGKFSGTDLSRLVVYYPDQDESIASGNLLSITVEGDSLRAELREPHLGSNDDNCNYDLATMTVARSQSDDAASRDKATANFFEAQSAGIKAAGLVSAGRFADALPLYKKAFALVEETAGKNNILTASYVSGLAGVYVKLGRMKEFNELFDLRIAEVKNQSARALFTTQCVRILLRNGREAVQREEYPDAMVFFKKAYELAPENAETSAGIMLVYLRTDRRDEAVSFLEAVLKSMDNETGRNAISVALANIYLEKADLSDKAGKIDDAIADLEKAERLNPRSARYLVALARLRHKSGNFEAAENVLQRGLERFQDETSQKEILTAREKIRQNEIIWKKLRQ